MAGLFPYKPLWHRVSAGETHGYQTRLTHIGIGSRPYSASSFREVGLFLTSGKAAKRPQKVQDSKSPGVILHHAMTPYAARH